MKKYFETFRLSFKMQLVWRFDVTMTMLAAVCRVLAAFILWGVVYNSRETVSGFTMDAMLSYYIVSAFLGSLDKSHRISGEVSELIRGGGFSKHIAVPMDPLGFFGAMAAGEAAFHLGFSLAAVAAVAYLCDVQVVFAADATIVCAAIAMAVMGIFFMMCFHYLMGILAFVFLSIGGLNFFIGNVIAFATGAMVPLALLPDGTQTIMRALPFYYVHYLPAMLATGRCADEAAAGLAVLSLWTAGLFILTRVSYGRLRTRYDGAGI